MIDPVIGWFELAEIPAKSADVVIDVLEQKWLNRYPRPTSVVMDHGREFMAEVKQTLKHDYGVQRKLITARNPQANTTSKQRILSSALYFGACAQTYYCRIEENKMFTHQWANHGRPYLYVLRKTFCNRRKITRRLTAYILW
jgi:hypothetical protein